MPADISTILEPDNQNMQEIYKALTELMDMKGRVTGKTQLSRNAFRNMVGLEYIQSCMKKQFGYKGETLKVIIDQYEKHAVDLDRQGKKEMVEIFKAAFHKENETELKRPRSSLDTWIGRNKNI